jgi:hypothetical protein
MPGDITAVTYTLVLADGTMIDEPAVRESGGFSAFAGRSDLRRLVVHDGENLLFDVYLRPGLRPIFGRLWVQSLNLATGEQTKWLRAVCCGWQQTVETTGGPRNFKSLLWITPHGVAVGDRDLDELAEV